jgi:predicted ATPase
LSALCTSQDVGITVLATSRSIDKKQETENMRTVFQNSKIVKLDRLQKEDTERLILFSTNSKSVGSNLLLFIQNRSEGNPLFAKQLLLTLQSTNKIIVEKSNDLCQFLTKEMDESLMKLSSTIQSVFMSRVDQLNVKLQLIVKISSVIGFNVNLKLLHNLLFENNSGNSTKSMKDLITNIQQLCELEILDPSFVQQAKIVNYC